MLLGDAGLMKELKVKLMERMPVAELTAHPGYEDGKEAPPGQGNRRNGASTKVLKGQDGGMPLAVPRDRDSGFEPELVKKGRTRTCGMDDEIIGLHAAGLTVRDIQAHLLDHHGLKVSPDLISRVADAVLDEVRDWQSRAPDRMSPIVSFDGRHCRAIGPSDNGDAGEDPRCRQPDGQDQGDACRPRRQPRRPARGSGVTRIRKQSPRTVF
ncbi:transposase [Roseovarius sp. D22-M7]